MAESPPLLLWPWPEEAMSRGTVREGWEGLVRAGERKCVSIIAKLREIIGGMGGKRVGSWGWSCAFRSSALSALFS